jgi:hypothetical protein
LVEVKEQADNFGAPHGSHFENIFLVDPGLRYDLHQGGAGDKWA